MKIAFISDIHANLHALQAVWADLEALNAEMVYCLGDLVGYGAFPNETIAFLQERDTPTIMGNYDEGVGFDKEDCGCVYKDPVQDQLGKRSIKWTREHTTQGNKDYLRSLPMQIRDEQHHPTLLLVHASPRKINEYVYKNRSEATFERIAKIAEADILLFGHTHLPYNKRVGETLFVNCGSVGKPKDGNPQAGYVMLSMGTKTEVEFRRVAYEVGAAAKAIRESDLPDEFAEALETGGV